MATHNWASFSNGKRNRIPQKPGPFPHSPNDVPLDLAPKKQKLDDTAAPIKVVPFILGERRRFPEATRCDNIGAEGVNKNAMHSHKSHFNDFSNRSVVANEYTGVTYVSDICETSSLGEAVTHSSELSPNETFLSKNTHYEEACQLNPKKQFLKRSLTTENDSYMPSFKDCVGNGDTDLSPLQTPIGLQFTTYRNRATSEQRKMSLPQLDISPPSKTASSRNKENLKEPESNPRKGANRSNKHLKLDQFLETLRRIETQWLECPRLNMNHPKPLVDVLKRAIPLDLRDHIHWAKQLPGMSSVSLDTLQVMFRQMGVSLQIVTGVWNTAQSNVQPDSLMFYPNLTLDRREIDKLGLAEISGSLFDLRQSMEMLKVTKDEYLVLKSTVFSNIDVTRISWEDQGYVEQLQRTCARSLPELCSINVPSQPSRAAKILCFLHKIQTLFSLPLLDDFNQTFSDDVSMMMAAMSIGSTKSD